MLYYGFAKEYGGKAFLKEYIKLSQKRIFILEDICELKKMIKETKKAIFYICPGGERGEGKEMINLALLYGHKVVGLVDHYTNPWQRFSDEISGEILKYKPNKIIVRSNKCFNRLKEYGFNGDIQIVKIKNKNKTNLNGESIGIKDKRLIIIVTEWYAKQKKLELDQSDNETLISLIMGIIQICEKHKNLYYSLKLHPKLIDENINFKDYKDSKKFINIDGKSNEEMIKSNPIFIGIDSSFLLKARYNNCLAYSWHREGSSFKISDYENDIIEIKNIEDIAWE